MDFIGIQNPDKCTNCYKCVQDCFTKAIILDKEQNLVKINKDICVECGYCTKSCKSNIPFIQTNYEKLDVLLSEGKEIYLLLYNACIPCKYVLQIQ